MKRLVNLIIQEFVTDRTILLTSSYPVGLQEYMVKFNSPKGGFKVYIEFHNSNSGVLKILESNFVKSFKFTVSDKNFDMFLEYISSYEDEFEGYMLKLSKRRGD